MGNRKDTEKYILEHIKLISGEFDYKLYKDSFSKMNNKEFDEFMVRLRDGKEVLSITMPNDFEKKNDNFTIERALDLAKQLKVKIFHKLTYTDTMIKSPIEFIVLDLPVRRASQLLKKKIALAKNNNSRDSATGQVTNKSAAAKMSFPELQMLAGVGMEKSLIELVKNRGGDEGAERAMTALLEKNGTVSQDQIVSYSTGVESTHTLKSILNAAQLSTNVTQK